MQAYFAPPHPPHVQVAQLRRTGQCGDDLAHFLHHRRIHFGIEQHAAGVAQQPDGPAPYQHGADDSHHRIEPGCTEVLAARQCDDRQHGRGGIRDDVEVRRTQVQVVMVCMAIVAVAVGVMIVPVMLMTRIMPRRQQPGRQHVDRKPEDGDGNGLVEADRRRIEEPRHRLDPHVRGHADQEHGAGVAAEHLDLPRAERKARVVGMASRQVVRTRRNTERQRVRTHVPAIGQQRHGTEHGARGDLDDHHHEREPHHLPRAALGNGIAGVEDVNVGVVAAGR